MNNPFSKETLTFSMLSPVYGDDWTHLEDYLQSIKNQEYPHYEVVLIFDGENPEGEAEIERLVNDKRFKKMDITYHVMTPHGGKAAAINYGFDKTKGDIISVLDSDNFLYPEALRLWANEFEDPKVNRVWNYYEIYGPDGNPVPVGGGIPSTPSKPDYWAVRFSPYIDSASPIRRTAWLPWNTQLKSLLDWDWSLRQLAKTDYRGDDFVYLARPLFIASPIEEGGLSDDSHKNWLERVRQIKKLNNIPLSDNVVASLGAVHHGLHIAKRLGWDFMPMPSFKQNEYKKVYLLGFYPGNPGTTEHLKIFAKPGITPRLMSDRVYTEDYTEAKKIIHWIGTDVLKMRTEMPFVTIKQLVKTWKEIGVIHLVECTWLQEELAEIGIDAKLVPIPPKKIWEESLPLPEKFTVGVYESSAQPLYNYPLMVEIARSMPDIDFKFFGDPGKTEVESNITHYGYTDLEKLMPEMSMNLRITYHDGMPLIPLEFLTAGRNVVTNVPMGHGTIEVGYDRKEIVAAIRKAQAEPLDPKWATYWRKEMSFDKYKKTMEAL